jgi:hypothetical protein
MQRLIHCVKASSDLCETVLSTYINDIARDSVVAPYKTTFESLNESPTQRLSAHSLNHAFGSPFTTCRKFNIEFDTRHVQRMSFMKTESLRG